MKFVIIGPAYPYRGGIAHHVYWLARELGRRGHQVRVLSFRRLYPRLFFPGSSQLDLSKFRLDPGASRVLDSLNPLTWHRAARLSKSFTPDVVLIQWWHPFFSPLLGSLGRQFQKAGIETILECHNVYPHERFWLDGFLVHAGLSPFRSFITHSHDDQQTLLKLFPTRTVRVAPLPTLREFAVDRRQPLSSRIALFFGMVRPYKGLDVLLRAMPKVLEKTNVELLIAGEFYEPIEKYKRLIRELGIDGHVRIDSRYIPNEELGELFRQARVLIMPYWKATQSGIVRMATSSRLPIIASQTGGLAEAVVEGVNGWLVPPGDVDALAGAMVKVFSQDPAVSLLKDSDIPAPPGTEERLVAVIEELAARS